MSGLGVRKFIALVEVHYPRQRFAGDEAKEALWLASMSEMLGQYDDDVLVEAAGQIVKNRDPDKDGAMFPKPKHCIDACERAKETLRLRRTPLIESREMLEKRLAQLHGADLAAWSKDRFALADDLCRSRLGAQAVREGWVAELHTFCRKEMRLPVGEEIGECIADAQATEAHFRRDVSGFWATIARSFEDYYRRKQADLSKKILGAN